MTTQRENETVRGRATSAGLVDAAPVAQPAELSENEIASISGGGLGGSPIGKGSSPDVVMTSNAMKPL